MKLLVLLAATVFSAGCAKGDAKNRAEQHTPEDRTFTPQYQAHAINGKVVAISGTIEEFTSSGSSQYQYQFQGTKAAEVFKAMGLKKYAVPGAHGCRYTGTMTIVSKEQNGSLVERKFNIVCESDLEEIGTPQFMYKSKVRLTKEFLSPF